MQLHILVACQGANRNAILAISLDITESSTSYTFFAQQCKEMGLIDLSEVERKVFPIKPVLFFDGMKGVESAIRIWGGNLHHAACCHYLAGSCRVSIKTQRLAAFAANKNGSGNSSAVEVPTINLSDHQIYHLCRASKELYYRTQMNSLTLSNKFAGNTCRTRT